MNTWQVHLGDVRTVLAGLLAGSAQTCVTSPPYFGLRDYGVAGQIGLEATPDAYVAELVAVFREVRRVLRDDGTLWLNLGDSYAGSWGAQSRPQGPTGQMAGRSVTSARQIEAAPKRVRTGSIGSDWGCKPKDLIGIPWLVAFALRADGWYLRSDIIWAKPNPMPESVTDRPTKAHEYIFLLSKGARYYYDAAAIRSADCIYGRVTGRGVGKEADKHPEGRQPQRSNSGGFPPRSDKQRGHGRRHAGFNDRWDAMEKAEQIADGANKRTVWTVATQPYEGAHFATFPEDLIEPCILAGSRPGDTVLDPFTGSGTTGAVAVRHQRNFIGCELNPQYLALARERIGGVAPMFAQEVA